MLPSFLETRPVASTRPSARPASAPPSKVIQSALSVLLFMSGATLGMVIANLLTVVTLGLCPTSMPPKPTAAPSQPFAYLEDF